MAKTDFKDLKLYYSNSMMSLRKETMKMPLKVFVPY